MHRGLDTERKIGVPFRINQSERFLSTSETVDVAKRGQLTPIAFGIRVQRVSNARGSNI